MDTVNPTIHIEQDRTDDPKAGLIARFAGRVANIFRTKGSGLEECAEEIVEIPESFKKMVYEFLHICFCLPEDQIPYEVILSIFATSNSTEPTVYDIKSVLSSDLPQSRDLLSLSIQSYVKQTGGFELEPDELQAVVEDLRCQIAALPADFEFDIRKFIEINTTVRQRVESIILQADCEMIRPDRLEAVTQMDRNYSEVFEKWRENPYAMNDEVMERFFVRNDQLMEGVDDLGSQFLTTYFDTAQFGLKNQILTDEADNLSRRKMDFMDYLHKYKEAVLRHFEPKKYDNLSARILGRHEPLRFTRPSENLFTTANGTRAFQLFCEAYIKEGDTILITPQEYGEMVEILKKKANVIVMPDYKEGMSRQEYRKRIITLLQQNKIDYVLVSHLSRHGTPFPLADLHGLLDEYSCDTDLIVDGVQSIGRQTIDFNEVRPSVFIGSTQKGSNVGGTLGVLMLSDDFIERKGLAESITEKGSVDPSDLARLLVACSPELLGSGFNAEISNKDLRKMTASVREKEKVIIELASNFAELVNSINKKRGNKIEITHPRNIYCEEGTILRDALSCIFTCKIDGVDRDTVRGIAEGYGVTINNYWDEPEPGVSFRIALHPFMGNDAIKILGYVLDECSRLK